MYNDKQGATVSMKADLRRVALATTAIATYEDKSGFLPIDNEDDMVSFEKLLKSDVKARSGFINTLKKLKGSDNNSLAMNKCFRHCFSDKFLDGYNLTGSHNKKSLGSRFIVMNIFYGNGA
jgi:hypothetical protein